MGFVLDFVEANNLITRNSRNSDVIHPYLRGEDLNSRPDQSPSCSVINFLDWPLEKAQMYPESFQILEERVKKEREQLFDGGSSAKDRARRWWQFSRPTLDLYSRLSTLTRVLCVARVTKYVSFVFVPKGYIYNEKIIVITHDNNSYFCVVQSNFHNAWAWHYSSTLGATTLNYSPTDVFETFPFPACLLEEGSRKDAKTQSAPGLCAFAPLRETLDRIGESYHEYRRQIMLQRQEGLTKTYNRFHAPGETAADISELRRLHVEMDNAVAAAYGWGDLDLGHGFHQTKQGLRYTISEAARRTVLDRLLALNHARYAEEVAEGLHDKDGSRKGAKAQRGGKGKVEGQGELL